MVRAVKQAIHFSLVWMIVIRTDLKCQMFIEHFVRSLQCHHFALNFALNLSALHSHNIIKALF